MKIAACLCWYDEPVAFLERCVLSLAGVADVLVHADGAWQLFPDGKARSPIHQRATLFSAAVDAGLPVWEAKTENGEIWESQVFKRSRLYREAISIAQPDWLLVIDADEHVALASDDLRTKLASISTDVASVAIIEATRDLIKGESASRRLFRGAEVAGVLETHNGVVTHDGRWLNGPRSRIKREATTDLGEYLRLEHEAHGRPIHRDKQGERYYEARAARRIEIA